MRHISVSGGFAIFSVVIVLVRGHSWIACTDYAEKNAGTFSHSKCRGYARNAFQYAPFGGTFGEDKGFDHQPSENSPCKSGRDDSLYDFQEPMAVYYPGQQVVLAHPMKNHGADAGCTNIHIPDNGNWIYRGNKNEDSDLTLTEYFNNLVADLGKSPTGNDNVQSSTYPKPGFQNAPLFCTNTDKSLGTYSFNVPSDLEPGQYTFVWVWAFNSLTNLYSTCFEVEIVPSLQDRKNRLMERQFFNFYEPCGGLTSDGSPGNTNPECTTDSSSSTVPIISTTPGTISTTAPTTTTTQQPGVVSLGVLTHQMTGEVGLPQAVFGTQRRYLSVHWDCPVTANFWNARVIAQQNVGDKRRRKRHAEGVHYDLLQEGSSQVSSGKFFYHATFSDACDLQAYPPIAKLEYDGM